MLHALTTLFTTTPGRPHHYASVDCNAVCTGVWRFDEPRDDERLIRIDSLDASLIAKRWNGSAWESVQAT